MRTLQSKAKDERIILIFPLTNSPIKTETRALPLSVINCSMFGRKSTRRGVTAQIKSKVGRIGPGKGSRRAKTVQPYRRYRPLMEAEKETIRDRTEVSAWRDRIFGTTRTMGSCFPHGKRQAINNDELKSHTSNASGQFRRFKRSDELMFVGPVGAVLAAFRIWKRIHTAGKQANEQADTTKTERRKRKRREQEKKDSSQMRRINGRQ
ncbi:hypothetical protein Trydic_g6864 [Trypoxylus dichotomus]